MRPKRVFQQTVKPFLRGVNGVAKRFAEKLEKQIPHPAEAGFGMTKIKNFLQRS
jgi:hypothetical protein